MRTAFFLSLTLLLAPLADSYGNVVRRAPDFSWPAAGNKTRSLKSLRGQPVVLVVAANPKNKAFRKQIDWLKQTYSQLAAKGAIFIVAFREGEGPVQSDIPFVVANNGPAVASAYNVEGNFALVVIGKDGNVDYQTDQVRTGERVRDMVINNYEVQAATRK